jgi:hypothetical protein
MKYYNSIFILVSFLFFWGTPGYSEDFNESETLMASLETIQEILPESPDKWEMIDESDGIKLYQKKNCNEDTFKTECIIGSSLEAIFKVLYDIPAHTRWVKYCNFSSIIKQTNANGLIHYYNFDMPWPFQNRDMVVNTFLYKDWNNREIRIYGNAFNDKAIPVKEGHIRVTESTHEWVLKEIGHGLTKVTYKSRTILNDSMPEMFACHLSKTMPQSMLLNLKKITQTAPDRASDRYIAKVEKTK